MTTNKRCTDCKHTKGIGYDFWCGEGHTEYEVFGAETNCPYYEYHDWSKGTPSKTEKRFTYFKSKIGFGKQGIDDNLKGYTFDFTLDNVLDCMNDLSDEIEQLRLQLNNCSDQRNEFHRGARENANRVGKLEKENEQLKKSVNNLKETIIKITIAYQRKYDRTIVDLVDESTR